MQEECLEFCLTAQAAIRCAANSVKRSDPNPDPGVNAAEKVKYCSLIFYFYFFLNFLTIQCFFFFPRRTRRRRKC